MPKTPTKVSDIRHAIISLLSWLLEYDDDTAIVPRSTAVIARRLPAAKSGRGGAARYVSGKMPQNAKSSQKSDVASSRSVDQAKPVNGIQQMPGANDFQTEEQRIAAMFQQGADQWAQQQQAMARSEYPCNIPKGSTRSDHTRRARSPILQEPQAHKANQVNSATPVYRGPPNQSKNSNVPDKPLPPGYICYRCGEKGKAIACRPYWRIKY